MKLKIAAYENGDHTCLVWFPDDLAPIAGCRGFGIWRERTRADGTKAAGYIRNFTGFSDTDPPPAEGEEWRWPVQRYLWWDYDVQPGDTVTYKVIPVTGPKDHLRLEEGMASAVTSALEVTGQFTDHLAAYFNKGIIASQWVARALADEQQNQDSQKTTLTAVIDRIGNPLRNALGGLLRQQIVAALDEVRTKGGSIYAALYELNDPELIAELKQLGGKVNLILGNGAFKPPDMDENEAIRADLKKTDIHVYDRIVGQGHFAHNKFVVFCDEKGKARKVLTGSTNWTRTGLCTQANNAVFIVDDAVADAFRAEWDRLRKAGNGFPATLVQANSKQQSFAVDGGQVTVWFVPTSQQQDLEQARALVNGAKDGVLFLFFNPGNFAEEPGKETLLQTIVERHRKGTSHFDPKLYLRGVVNQKIAGLTDDAPPSNAKKPAHTDEVDESHDPSAANTPVLLYSSGKTPPERATKDVLVPAAIKEKFGHWVNELLSMGVMVHSKVVVVDPFGDHPVLMTGSHNLGTKASGKNDDNLVIVEGAGARGIAIAFAVNIIAIYQEYRWRKYVADHATDPHAWHVLQDDDAWQAGHLMREGDELKFWIGGGAVAAKANRARVAAATTPPRLALAAHGKHTKSQRVPALPAVRKKRPASKPRPRAT